MKSRTQACTIWRFGLLALWVLSPLPHASFLSAQTSAPQPAPADSRNPAHDAALEGAQATIGRALILRGGYAGGELTYDASGHIQGEPRQLDWTLAGADIEKVVRRGPGSGAGELELDGQRVAMRYNPDQHLFERHILKNEKLKIILAVNAEAHGLQAALATIFAVGIDPALQRAMPPSWRHYFSPGMPWPSDDLTGQTVIPLAQTGAADVEPPVLEKRLEPEFTSEARDDHVKGVVAVRLTVGTDGVPRRIAIRQPLGYGLDARVVETVGRYRFHPGMKDGKPVAMEMLVNQTFDYYPPPR